MTRTSSCGWCSASVAPGFDGPGDPGIEVVDLDVEVDHHLLRISNGRPLWWLVVLLPLELELEVSLWGAQLGPPVLGRVAVPRSLALDHRPAEKLFVEAGEADGVGGVEHRSADLHPRPIHVGGQSISAATSATGTSSTALSLDWPIRVAGEFHPDQGALGGIDDDDLIDVAGAVEGQLLPRLIASGHDLNHQCGSRGVRPVLTRLKEAEIRDPIVVRFTDIEGVDDVESPRRCKSPQQDRHPRAELGVRYSWRRVHVIVAFPYFVVQVGACRSARFDQCLELLRAFPEDDCPHVLRVTVACQPVGR